MNPRPLQHPGRWIWLLLAIPVAIGLLRLRFDVDVFKLLPDDIPEVRGLKMYQQHFANARELLVTVRGADAETTEAAARSIAQHLRDRTNLAASVTWTPPWMERPDQAAELLAFLWLNQPPEDFTRLADALQPRNLPELLAGVRQQLATSLSPEDIGRLSYDPFGLTRLPEMAASAAPSFGRGQEAFASEDGTFRILYVQAPAELRNYRECVGWLEELKPVIETAARNVGTGGISLGYTGRPAFEAEAATAMQKDMTLSVGGTAIIIAILFWLAHRRVKPMLWLLTLLALVLAATLALGGLFFGAINVVSMGFAAILLGLAVDYAVVHYQEALAHPKLTVPEVRRAIAPSIFWAAITTIAAFFVLNFGGLPGLAQLGSLVGLGVALAAFIMVFEYLPPLFPDRRGSQSTEASAPAPKKPSGPFGPPQPSPQSHLCGRGPVWLTAVLFVFCAVVLGTGLPTVDPTSNALRPRGSSAYVAMEEIQQHIAQSADPLWVIISGRTESEVALRLANVDSLLQKAREAGAVQDFTLPTPLWPHPPHQEANRKTAARLASQRQAFARTALENGFTDQALLLTGKILDSWEAMSGTGGTVWPTNQLSRWVFSKFTARSGTDQFALGLVRGSDRPSGSSAEHRHSPIPAEGGRRSSEPPLRGSVFPSPTSGLAQELAREEALLSGWPMLGSAIYSRVQGNFWKVLAPMIGLVLLSLWMAFRRGIEPLLSIGVLLLSGLCLLTTMRLAGWSWNLMNLMAVPLVLGTGVDYSIFMQLALRRHGGNQRIVYQSVGCALLLCGGTAITGFGTLALSSNAGMASLGAVCAAGIAFNMLISIWLLPIWWKKFAGSNSQEAEPEPSNPSARPASSPSSLYRSEFWRLGTWAANRLPHGISNALARSIAEAYWMFAPHRRECVMANLLPPLNGDRSAARRAAKSLFRQFALKLLDLWRYESGASIEHLLGTATGWEHFEKAFSRKKGVLLLTPHLGNWEFGGPWLTRNGVDLHVITLAEPGQDFTELRQAARSRWNISTLVIGNDPFAFIEIIKRLENGAVVALLIDRPPPPTAVTVELFGRPFDASIAAAELARASGCALLPVYIPRTGERYSGHILPPVEYERATLRDRTARKELTQRILKAFEPAIREHLDQWYHFVPVWRSCSPLRSRPRI